MQNCFLVSLAGSLLLCAGSLKAATFTATTPKAADDPGNITLSLGALPVHQAVQIESFADLDGDGIIDAGEPLVLSFKVIDGEVPLFGGVRDTNRPGDEDGLTNGQMTVVLTLPQLAERCRIVGKYVLRLSASGNPFAAVTTPFEVSSANASQAVTGTVRAAGNPVGSAVIVLLSASGDDMEFVAGATADGAGHFSIAAPSGEYMLLAFKDGYVGGGEGAAFVSLESNVNASQDVGLEVANRLISGNAFDAFSSNAIPGLQLFLQADDHVNLVVTDANGNFSVPVTPGLWEIEQSDQSLALLGYGRLDSQADTTAGNVTGLPLALTRARGELQLVFFFQGGIFGGGTNGLYNFPTHLDYYYALYNVNDTAFPTNVFFTGPAGSGLSNSASAVFGGNYGGDSAFYSSPQVTVPSYPPGGSYEVNYKGEAQQFLISDPDAQNRQVILQPTVSVSQAGLVESMTWVFRNTAGNVIAAPSFATEIEIRIEGISDGRLYDAELSPTSTSHVLESSVTWTNVSSIQMVYNDDRGNQYVIFWHRASQPLQIVSGSVPSGRVNVGYHTLFVAAGGWTPYSWSFVSGDLPPGVTFTPVTGELNGTPTASGTFNFTVRVTDQYSQQLDRSFSLTVQPPIAPAQLTAMPMTGGQGQFDLSFSSDVGATYALECSTNLINWSTVFTTNATGGTVTLTDPNANGNSKFYRTVLMP